MIEILKALAEKAGVSNTPAFVTLIASPEIQSLKGITLDPEIEKSLNANLINVEAAKTHKDVVNYIKGQELGKVDSTLKKALLDLGLNEAQVNDVMSSGPTETKTLKALEVAQKQQEKKAQATGGDKEKALAQQIEDLKKIRESDLAVKQSEIDRLKGDFEGYKSDSALRNFLMSQPLRDDLSAEDNLLLAKQDINKFLSSKKAVMKFTDNGFEFRDAENPEVAYLDRDSGSHLKFENVVTKLLTDNKRIKVSNPNSTQQQTTAASANPAVRMPNDAMLERLISDSQKG